MDRIQPSPIKIPPPAPFAAKAPSFPSLPKFDFSRALTTRNVAIVLGAGFIAWMAYRYFFSSSQANSNPSTPISTPPTKTPNNELEFNLNQKCYQIVESLRSYSKDSSSSANTLKEAKSNIELLNTLSASVTKAQIRNIRLPVFF